MILADWQIEGRRIITKDNAGRQPYNDSVLSYGLTSFGYDARLGPEMMGLRHQIATYHGFHRPPVMDPKRHYPSAWETLVPTDGVFRLAPGRMYLGHTVEYFKIPRDIQVVCYAKSTYARLGLFVNVTPLEPEWEGQVTLEFFNSSGLDMILYPGEGICQFVFHHGDEPDVSYADKGGKYQGQTGVTLARA